jgi:hypothetical protein
MANDNHGIAASTPAYETKINKKIFFQRKT